MKCVEQVRNVYVRVQMWKAVYCYIISTNIWAKGQILDKGGGFEGIERGQH